MWVYCHVCANMNQFSAAHRRVSNHRRGRVSFLASRVRLGPYLALEVSIARNKRTTSVRDTVPTPPATYPCPLTEGLIMFLVVKGFCD